MKNYKNWIPLQANEEVVLPIDLCIRLPSGLLEVISTSKHWSLLNVRDHLKIVASEDISKAHFKVKNRKVYFVTL